jgi:hypothetical protein
LTDLEGLHPDLLPYVGRHGMGRYINSPLVEVRHLDIPYPKFPDDAGDAGSWVEWANQRLATKRDMLATAINERDWETYIFAHERPYRFDAIRTLIQDGHATIDDLWPAVADAWSDSENIHQFADEWLDLWRRPSPRKHEAMSEADRAVWGSLPDILTIYRGVNCSEGWEAFDALASGLSWTLDREKAVWFANRGSEKPFIAKRTIKKSDCFTYVSDRQEQEVIIDHDRGDAMQIEKLKRERRARR